MTRFSFSLLYAQEIASRAITFQLMQKSKPTLGLRSMQLRVRATPAHYLSGGEMD